MLRQAFAHLRGSSRELVAISRYIMLLDYGNFNTPVCEPVNFSTRRVGRAGQYAIVSLPVMDGAPAQWGHAIAINMIGSNPASGVKKFKIESDGYHTWTEAEVTQFKARHPVGSKARLALALLLTGQRGGDVRLMGWQNLTNGAIAIKQEKTGVRLLIPLDIDSSLAECLATVPRTNMTFLTTEYGAPFTRKGFGNWFRDRCNEAGLPQCTAHGLRKLVATRLADVSCSEEEIKAITGHRSSSEVARYIKARDQKRLAQNAAAKLKRARTEGEQDLSNLATRLDKMPRK
jgi:integrase